MEDSENGLSLDLEGRCVRLSHSIFFPLSSAPISYWWARHQLKLHVFFKHLTSKASDHTLYWNPAQIQMQIPLQWIDHRERISQAPYKESSLLRLLHTLWGVWECFFKLIIIFIICIWLLLQMASLEYEPFNMFWYCVDAKHRNHCGKAKKSRFFLCCIREAYIQATITPYSCPITPLHWLIHGSDTERISYSLCNCRFQWIIGVVAYASFSRQVNCSVIIQLLLKLVPF